jgi:hypothetical protein
MWFGHGEWFGRGDGVMLPKLHHNALSGKLTSYQTLAGTTAQQGTELLQTSEWLCGGGSYRVTRDMHSDATSFGCF